MANIAYVILTYKEPERVVRLINRILTPSDLVYVHFDTLVGKKKFNDWKKFVKQKCPSENIEIVSKFRCKWAGFGSIYAVLDAMNYFEKYAYDYFIHLTGDCYPLKPPELIKKTLDGCNMALMTHWKLPYDKWYEGGLNRINRRFYFVPRPGYPYVWIFSIPRLKEGLPHGLEPYGGHGGICLQKKHVSYILRFVKKHPDLIDFYKHTFAPDEMFFETILMNSPLKNSVINQSIRYDDFSEGKSHPKNLTREDLESLRKSGKLFARKFNLSVDKDILDIIDKEIERIRSNSELKS